MKKILFTLMFSAVVFSGFQDSYAGREENNNTKGPQRTLPNPDSTNVRTNRQPQWIPQAPISQEKSPGLYQKWLSKAEQAPNNYRISGNTPYIFQ